MQDMFAKFWLLLLPISASRQFLVQEVGVVSAVKSSERVD
jgi:hypothetical protein